MEDSIFLLEVGRASLCALFYAILYKGPGYTWVFDCRVGGRCRCRESLSCSRVSFVVQVFPSEENEAPSDGRIMFGVHLRALEGEIPVLLWCQGGVCGGPPQGGLGAGKA